MAPINAFDTIFSKAIPIQNDFLKLISNYDSDEFFKIKHYKASRFNKLKKTFSSNLNNFSEGFNLSFGRNFSFENWSHLEKYIDASSVEFLEANFFLENNSESEFINKCNSLRGKVVITTNHDICKTDFNTLLNLQRFFLSCEETLFAGWDWDNHHNLAISSIYALSSDIFFPSQRDNLYELSKLTNLNFFIAPSAYEWDRGFFSENLDTLINSQREIDIFGTFNFYSRFPYRNQVIKTLSEQIPEIRFIPDFSEYTSKSQEQKFSEWCNSKWHWLVPTLNAVSVRAFYALIAGVGVILPVEFKSFAEFADLDPRDVIWYSATDVIDTTRVKNEAIRKYRESGIDGVLRRHRFALDHHNLDCRVREMVSTITSELIAD